VQAPIGIAANVCSVPSRPGQRHVDLAGRLHGRRRRGGRRL